MGIYRSLFCVIFFQIMASLAIFATTDETVQPPKDSSDAALKSPEGAKDAGSPVISEAPKPEKPVEAPKDSTDGALKSPEGEGAKDAGLPVISEAPKPEKPVEAPKDSSDAALKSPEGEGAKDVSSQVISEEPKDEKKNEKINYVFNEEEIDGAGGYIFIGDGFLLGNGLQQSLSYGGTFFFSFAKKIRFGFSGGYIETLDNSNTNRFFIGSYSAYLLRFSKFWTSLGMNLGYGSINKTASFNVAPELAFALHLAKDFGISLSASYLLFINEQTFLSKKNLFDSSIPLLSFRLEFGSI